MREALADAVIIDPVIEAAWIGALIEITVAGIAKAPVAHDEDRHRRGIDAGE
jgi:hypothetical protein